MSKECVLKLHGRPECCCTCRNLVKVYDQIFNGKELGVACALTCYGVAYMKQPHGICEFFMKKKENKP